MIASYRSLRKKRQQGHLSKAERSQPDMPSQSPPSTATSEPKKKQKCPVCVKEKSAARRYRWKIIFCLLPAFLDSSLDLTVIATALPRIASHFSKSRRAMQPTPANQSSRQVQSTQLDRHCIYIDLDSFHSCLRPAGRYFWSICRHHVLRLGSGHWQCLMCLGPCMGSLAPWAITARHWSGWYTNYHHHYTRRQGDA